MHLRKKTYKNLNESRLLYSFNSVIRLLQTERNESGGGGQGKDGAQIQPISFLYYVRCFVPLGAC